jgi:1-deoxy-D-xylulose-5-phosphate synthase
MAPSNGLEMYQMLNTAFTMKSPVCIRYPRGVANVENYETQDTVEIGKAKVLLKGEKTAIFAFGNRVEAALEAGTELGASVIDMRFVKPLDTQLIEEIASTHQQLITIEDNVISGGGGSAISEYLHQQKITTPLRILGLPDEFTEQGTQAELYQQYGLTTKGIINATKI